MAGLAIPAAATAAPAVFKACRRVSAISFPPKEKNCRWPLRTLMADYNLELPLRKAGLPTCSILDSVESGQRRIDQRFGVRSDATAGCVASLCFMMRWLAV